MSTFHEDSLEEAKRRWAAARHAHDLADSPAWQAAYGTFFPQKYEPSLPNNLPANLPTPEANVSSESGPALPEEGGEVAST